MVDLRDDRVVRQTFLHQLLDPEGNDLKNVYEPLTNQVGYVICFCISILVAHFTWKRFLRWRQAPEKFTPYKVIKPPSSMLSERQASSGESKKKSVCAVVGGTGFIGHHIVNELLSRGEYYVFVLGRKFHPKTTNSNADCLIQVDMMDLDGLTNALQGVDCVFNSTGFFPNVFLQADEMYSKSRVLHSNLLKAVKKAKVQNLVHLSGRYPNSKSKEIVYRAFINSIFETEKDIAAANGVSDLNTCVVGPCNILGLNSPIVDPLISGETKSFPMSDKMPTSFMPVEHLATIVVNAMDKLANPTTRKEVAGKVFPLRGELMSWKDLLSLPGWTQKFSPVPTWVLYMLIKINTVCAKWLQWAPFGPALSPVVWGVMGAVEKEMAEEEVQNVYDTLGVGPSKPPLSEYIGLLVSRYNAEKTEDKKEQ